MYTQRKRTTARYCTINSHYAILVNENRHGVVIVILMDFLENKKNFNFVIEILIFFICPNVSESIIQITIYLSISYPKMLGLLSLCEK